MDGLRDAISILPARNPAHQRASQLIEGLETNLELESLRASVEGWYDDAMERVCGVYKRRAQIWILVMAFIITALTGADTFRVIDYLSENSTARAAILARVDNTLATPTGGAPTALPSPTVAPAGGATTPQPTGTPMPPPTTTGGTGAPSPATVPSPTPPSIRDVLDELDALQLPLYYGDRPKPWPATWSGMLSYVVPKIAGLFVTTFAVSLGAPFWFDVLTRAANLRAAGRRPTAVEAERRQSN